MTNATQKIDILRAIETPTTAALHRTDLRKSTLPESQYVLRYVDFISDFADRAKCLWRLFQLPFPCGRSQQFAILRFAFVLGVNPLL